MDSEIIDKTVGDGDTEMAFDNLTILREFGNIANLVRDEDFLDTVPKAKLKRVKWLPMFNCLKKTILDDMVQELNAMWEEEDMPEKIKIIEKQKSKILEADSDKVMWRPQLGDINAQLRAHEVTNLQKQKKMLEALAKEYESRVNKLKKTVSARRGYLKAMQLDIQKYTKKSDECVAKLNLKIENHTQLVNKVSARSKADEIDWSEKNIEEEFLNENRM